jgi:3'-phosphoadenosine 5'-phosphosulfate sulfotransferase (PAPS reductase)/FAD synthetase
MNYEAWLKTCRIHWMRGIDKKIDAAKKMLLDFFSTVEKPYCAISGGKDSLVSLDLAMSVAPGTFDVCWGDEDFNMPGTREQISAIEHHYAIKVTRIRVRHGAREFRDMFGCYPACENPHPVDFEADTGKEVTAHFGWDGVILGLRSEESRQRRYAMTNPLRKLKGKDIWRVSPIPHWTYRDVWSYMVGMGLPVHKAYETMIEGGVDPSLARIGPFTAVRVWEYGAHENNRRFFPEEWNDFVRQNPFVPR